MEDLLPWIRLTKTGASARRLNTLLDYFGSPDALFGASVREVTLAARCSTAVAEKLLDPVYAANERDLTLMKRLGVRLIPRTDPEYPALLAEIPDPPVALYCRGSLLPADARSIAIVGSRQATDYGKRLAERFARELVEAGITVVSGLAKGLDTSAHQGAVRAGGRTLACLGCGVDVCYPYENRPLADSIVAQGAVLSEYPMNAPPDAWHFPSRNRIVSGLSLGVVVIEAPAKSGALITVECAL
jgi:DNA processing protein